MEDVTILFTGGTIDSYYDVNKCIPVPFSESKVPEYVEKSLFLDDSVSLNYVQICSKDSRDVTDADRQKMCEAIDGSPSARFVITHGTFTMFETAKYLRKHLKSQDKKIVITGSMVPLIGFYHSDAHFNLGYSLGYLQNTENGVWVCIKGRIFSAEEEAQLHF